MSGVTQKDALSVCLIGTSNGVFAEGYAKAFVQFRNFEMFENKSIGFCSGALFSYQYESIDFSRYDICFLDFSCNDTSLFESGILSELDIRRQLEFAIARISLESCIPVLLIFPIRKALPDGGRVREIYLSVARQYHLPYFDGYEMLERMQGHGANAADQFSDSMHLNQDIAHIFGGLIADAMFTAWAERRDDALIPTEGFVYRCIDARGIAGPVGAVAQFATSLVTASCVEIGAQPVSVGAAPGEEICAVTVNFAQSVGVLQMQGGAAVAMRLTSEHYGADRSRLVFGMFPVSPAVREADGRFALTVAQDALADINCSHLPLRDEAPRASLIALIVRKQGYIAARTYFAQAVNLLSAATDERIRNIVPDMNGDVTAKVVAGVYRGLLGRGPDPEGLKNYCDIIVGNGFRDGVYKMIKHIQSSEEYKRRQA